VCSSDLNDQCKQGQTPANSLDLAESNQITLNTDNKKSG
jgi:hypothetical protein